LIGFVCQSIFDKEIIWTGISKSGTQNKAYAEKIQSMYGGLDPTSITPWNRMSSKKMNKSVNGRLNPMNTQPMFKHVPGHPMIFVWE
jgi:hypothetical protein